VILSSIHHDTSYSVEVVECTFSAGESQHVRENVQEYDFSFVAFPFRSVLVARFDNEIPFAHLPDDADPTGVLAAATRTLAFASTCILSFFHQM